MAVDDCRRLFVRGLVMAEPGEIEGAFGWRILSDLRGELADAFEAVVLHCQVGWRNYRSQYEHGRVWREEEGWLWKK